MISEQDDGWLLIAVSTAGASASLRVHVWRKLRGLGALYLQQSVCLLPDRPEITRQVRRLIERVRAEGGATRLLRMHLADHAERDQVVAEFNTARDAEYDEVLERLPGFFTELETETTQGRATYAEVEENEADLTRFRGWLAKIAARDYFAAPRADQARAELTRAEAAFTRFEAAALATDLPAESPVEPSTTSHLTAVGDDYDG